MFVNGIPIETYGGIMLGTPRVSPATITGNYFFGKSRSSLVALGSEVGIKTITCNVAFFGDSIHEIQIKRSQFRAALLGKINISFKKDGFEYFCIYSSDREMESEYDSAAVSSFTFTGIQHEPLETVVGRNVYCRSTVPRTDCKLSATAGQNYSTVKLGSVTFSNIQSGDVLVADGIEGKISVNGESVTADFIHIPYLVRGVNSIEGPLTPTVSYYPTYI